MEELPRHKGEAHPGFDHILTRFARMIGLYSVLAIFVFTLLAGFGELDSLWIGLPLTLWALLVFVALLIPVLVIAYKPLSKGYANASYRCWVCDAYIPHRTLSRHLRAEHPEEGGEFLLSQAMAAVVALSVPLCIVLPWLWRVVDPTLSLYLFLGPPVGAFSYAAFVAVYASRWPRRVERARGEWAAAHPGA